MSKVAAIIVAGGKGTRMGSGIKKQYLPLLGKEILVHTVECFEKIEEVDEIVVVTGEEDIEEVKVLLHERYKFTKVANIVVGGKERQYSVQNGLEAVSEAAGYVIIHDAARPLVTPQTILKALKVTKEKGATIVAVPVKDTIKIATKEGVIASTPDRSTLWSVQTPQSFKKELIEQAFKFAEEHHLLGTDDSSLVEAMGETVHIVEGEYTNIKVTTPEDLYIAETILKERKEAL